MSATVYSFGEWLPDQPALSNPGLTLAKNVLPKSTFYKPFLPLDTSYGTLPASSVAGSIAVSGFTKGSQSLFAFSGITYYESPSVIGAFTSRGSVAASGGIERFAQFENLVIGVGGSFHLPMRHTMGAASNFTTLAISGSAPYADVIGVIGDFVVLGSLGTSGAERQNVIAWSAIGDPTNWPTPNSATAIATQSGEEEMPTEFGAVQAIHGGDQYGVILQMKGVSRMTYAGPPVVFQFDVIDSTQGSYFKSGSIQVGRTVYFISTKGFCRTDGVAVQRIGNERVDRFFWDNYNNAYKILTGYDPVNELVCWALATSGGSVSADTMIFYDPNANRWSYALQNVLELTTPPLAEGVPPKKLLGFNVGASSIFGQFAATAGAATIATGDLELNPGGRAFVDGVKPNIESTGTAPAVTVRVGIRDSLSTTPSYSATTTPTTRTGFADFRLDAKYHRAEVQIVGNFDKATGIEFKAQPTGET